MLSQDDRRELELIATQLRTEDPEFARALAEGRPRRPKGDRRWPLLLAAVVAGLVFVAGLLTQTIGVMLLGVGVFGCAAIAYCVHARRSQGPRVRKNGPYLVSAGNGRVAG